MGRPAADEARDIRRGGEQVRLETSGGRSRSRADFGAQSWLGVFF